MSNLGIKPDHILVHDRRNARNFEDHCRKHIFRSNRTETFATKAANEQETPLHSRRNRVLLVTIWLRQYLKLHVLEHIFCISKSTMAEKIYHVKTEIRYSDGTNS